MSFLYRTGRGASLLAQTSTKYSIQRISTSRGSIANGFAAISSSTRTNASTTPPKKAAEQPIKASTANTSAIPASSLKQGVGDFPAEELMEDITSDVDLEKKGPDWSRSFHGLSTEPFPKEVANILMQPLNEDDIEIKPDGIIYLPEIKYRRILNTAFGPGGWGLAPRGETIVTEKPNGGGLVTREYALVCNGRLVSVARGEQDYFDEHGIPTAMEGCKSNALMRCCKDLGIASELWDPRKIRSFKKTHCKELFAEHVTTAKKKKIWIRNGDSLEYPWKASKFGA